MSAKHLQARAAELRADVSRVANKTLAGTFKNPDDRAYWVQRLHRLNGELSAIEDQLRPSRKAFQK